MDDPFDLRRFVDAQRGSYDVALAELRQGRKRTHWMWFVFPQIAGLGTSAMARHYAIGSIDEARAYLAHPVLGARFIAVVEALQDVAAGQATEIFGDVDALKLRSSLTLFDAAGAPAVVRAALERWFGGEVDPATLARLARP